jgi:hypothetical protein
MGNAIDKTHPIREAIEKIASKETTLKKIRSLAETKKSLLDANKTLYKKENNTQTFSIMSIEKQTCLGI